MKGSGINSLEKRAKDDAEVKSSKRSFSKFEYIISSLLAGILVITTYQTALRLFFDNRIPRENEVQSGFAVPSQLEINVYDENRGKYVPGKNEKNTIIRYFGNDFLLKVDGFGKLVVEEFEIDGAGKIVAQKSYDKSYTRVVK